MNKVKTQHYPDTSSNPDFPQIEERILKFWQETGAFGKSVENRADAEEWIFYDGPPFANGLPHYGHLLTSCVKDIFARYHTMKGEKVERRFGWDCHGLPAEMETEKELAISGRKAIEDFGIDKFNDHCRSSVMKYTDIWQDYIGRAARWVDFENDYKTMDTDYMESVLWAFRQLYDKGLIYESQRVMPYSWAAQTPLSNFETRMDDSYREVTDKAVTVAFELEDFPQSVRDEYPDVKTCKILAWTTTPWTLPSNLALAVKKDMDYLCVRNEDKCWIVGNFAQFTYDKELDLESIQEKHGFTGDVITGNELVNLKYKPLFPYFADTPNAFRILPGDFIEEGEGTGIVHLAPGFGEDDQRVCENSVDKDGNPAPIPVICPVDEAGCFTDAVFDLPNGTASGSPLEGEQTRQAPQERSSSRGGYSEKSVQKARALRQDATDAEKKLWYRIRNKKLCGHKFRRQQPVGKYIVDFICQEKKLVIELDGSQHAEQNEYDDERTKFLEDAGYKVIRFWNNEIFEDMESILETILYNLGTAPHDSSASLSGLASSAPPQGGSRLPASGGGLALSLKGLNVVTEKAKDKSEPYTDEQLEKYGLANLRIITWLKAQGNLIKQEDYTHSYPHCWRTDQKLIYKALPSWYVEVTKFRERMVDLNRNINWIPEHIRDGQFGKWLENARDWSISRNRFWGTPIPIWRTESGKTRAFGSIAELEEFFGVEVTDLHRPFIDTLTKEENGETWRRVTDVFDCWFESGSMPFAQVHYPFDNKQWFEEHFPADFIVEYVGQTRGWFYTLMVLATALFDKEPFKNCICHGVILDANGKKLSKKLRNYPDPQDMFDQYGADAMRWRMIKEPVMHGGNLLIRKDGNDIRDVVRLSIKPIWNAYHFFCLYANTDGVQGTEIRNQKSENLMDRYILSKLKVAVGEIERALDEFVTPEACKAVDEFFEVLNNWYIRRNRDRFWRKADADDADKQAAYDTLYTVLITMAMATAPLLPMTTEEIYQGLF